jgi:hypothetical protein
MPYNRFDVAARIRGLLAGQDGGIVSGTARRLGVDEISLRMSVDELDPRPTLDVLLATVREYGVDPTWLISGEYDIAMHRRALEDDAAIAHVLSVAATTNPAKPMRRNTPPRAIHSVSGAAADLAPDAGQGRPRLALVQETRTRVIDAEGIRWRVREEPWPSVDRRSGSCLIFDGDTVVRRVRHFPPDWWTQSDTDLYALSLGT